MTSVLGRSGERSGIARGSPPAARERDETDHEHDRPPRHPIPQARVRGSAIRGPDHAAHRGRFEQATRIHDPAVLVDERADAGHRRVHDPSSVLGRAEPAHQQVLLGGGGALVGGVVDHDDQEARAQARHLAVDRREAVLVADGRADLRQPRQRDQRDLLSGRPVHRHLVGRRDPAERSSERHVLAERHQLDLLVAVDDRARPVERQRDGALGAVAGVGDRTGDRRCSHRRDGVAHLVHGARIVRHTGIERSLAPDHEVRGILRQPQMAVDVESGDRDVFLVADEMLHRRDVHLQRGDIDRATIGVGRRDGGRDDGHGDRRHRERERPRPATTPPPLPREQQQPGHQHDRERERPHPPDRRERERRRVHLSRPELSPPEPAEREHAPDPFDDRPQARQPERPEHRVIPAPHGGRQGPEPRHEPGGHQHQGRPSELAEEQDPIQERAEVRDTEREAARGGPAGSGSTHEPQERDRRDEHEGPDPRRGERDRQQRTGGRRDQERVRKSEPARAQAQSRQSIFALSFSWLRCLTR